MNPELLLVQLPIAVLALGFAFSWTRRQRDIREALHCIDHLRFRIKQLEKGH